MANLNSNQLKEYQDQGYLAPIDILSKEEAKEARDEIELIEKEMPNEIDKSEFETAEFIDYKQQFQIFLFLSLLFIICDVFVFQTKTKWIQNLNLFNENKD